MESGLDVVKHKGVRRVAFQSDLTRVNGRAQTEESL